MGRGPWRPTVHGVSELDLTERLTHFTFFKLNKAAEDELHTWEGRISAKL